MDLQYLGIKEDVLKPYFTTPRLVEEAIRNNEGILLHHLPLAVRTGHTGRSPKDRFIVDDEETHSTVSWNEINQPLKKQHFNLLFQNAQEYLRTQDVYVEDVCCGADPHFRVNVRFIGTHAWQALFVRNMFLIPKEDEIEKEGSVQWPEWHVIAMPDAAVDEALERECELNSGDYIIINFTQKIVLIGGTGYAGEIKKSMFTVMNYILPERSVLPMHASVNVNKDEKITIFFGLSGTGKTTLALDPECRLLGDDEHGWSADGLFNLEGGCYAKTINLKREDEPLVFSATERHGTTVENVAYDALTRKIDYADGRYTENGRASFSIDAIPNAVISGMTGHPGGFYVCRGVSINLEYRFQLRAQQAA